MDESHLCRSLPNKVRRNLSTLCFGLSGEWVRKLNHFQRVQRVRAGEMSPEEVWGGERKEVRGDGERGGGRGEGIFGQEGRNR